MRIIISINVKVKTPNRKLSQLMQNKHHQATNWVEKSRWNDVLQYLTDNTKLYLYVNSGVNPNYKCSNCSTAVYRHVYNIHPIVTSWLSIEAVKWLSLQVDLAATTGIHRYEGRSLATVNKNQTTINREIQNKPGFQIGLSCIPLFGKGTTPSYLS